MGLEKPISLTCPGPLPPPPPPSSSLSSSWIRSNNDGTNKMMIPKSLPPPSPPCIPPSRELMLSTLLEKDDLVPLFDRAGWASTSIWSAAIWEIRYIMDHYYHQPQPQPTAVGKAHNRMSLCELGRWPGVPGIIWHQFGDDFVLTDQESIMSQLHANVRSNFTNTFLPRDHPHTQTADSDAGHGTN